MDYDRFTLIMAFISESVSRSGAIFGQLLFWPQTPSDHSALSHTAFAVKGVYLPSFLAPPPSPEHHPSFQPLRYSAASPLLSA